MSDTTDSGYDIAVIGLAGRFPGARNVDEFWRNLREGVESVTRFTDEELLAAGEPRRALQDPDYVRAQPTLSGFDRFDAGFFGFSPQDAAVMDPQHRIFLEVGWEVLENAGHTSGSFAGNIGVFAACGMNAYMMFNLVNNRRIMETVGEWLVRHTGNDMNFLATRLSYLLNLTGPSLNVQTACSSALVAIHLACQSLLSGECDMALAGGSTIALPQNRGYLYKPGEILSPDGHCRPFDAQARGTLFGSGAGAVALRRLKDAVADGDQILAIVKGSAINNDGSAKVGYLAPSVEGQAKAIAEALSISGVDPETIGYVEMHGTGTIVGDPIEVTGLTQAWRGFTDKRGICALGSLKSNIGHLGEAAGVAAFIKTVLALNHGEIPPSLNYESPNPQIDFVDSPFFVNATLAPWPDLGKARRAAVTALGAGGTNCHVILEKPPATAASGPSRPWQLLTLSAATPEALDAATTALASHLDQSPALNLADLAYTLKVGRKAFPHRRILACRYTADAAKALTALDPKRVFTRKAHEKASVVFMFPGGGAQYADMGRDLYENEPVYRATIDRCADYLRPSLGVDLRALMFPDGDVAAASLRMEAPSLALPALFATEYALAKLLLSWGVKPAAMIGHSMGEYVAACLAGVISDEAGLALVALRGRLFEKVEAGAMLAIALPEQDVRAMLEPGLSIAAVNAPALCVAAGPVASIKQLQTQLAGKEIDTTLVRISVAAHSPMLDPILDEFEAYCRRIPFAPPQIPYVSNLTGTWITAAEVVDPAYWVKHLRQSVRFGPGIQEILRDAQRVLIEVGPGRTLTSLARQQPVQPAAALSTMRHPAEESPDLAFLLTTLGQLWQAGAQVDWSGFYGEERRLRLALPTYPFQRQRYWIDADPARLAAAPSSPSTRDDESLVLEKQASMADWFSVPSWQRASPVRLAPARPSQADWLVFLDDEGLAGALAGRLAAQAPVEAEPTPQRLEISVAGEVDSLTLVPMERPAPGPGAVEIGVRVAALNFADGLKVTGVLSEKPWGMECAGTITRAGPGVVEFQPGDDVIAVGPESFRSFVLRDARWVARKPDSMTYQDAVTLPAAFMTAWHALGHIGKVQRGERVLIHAASGGVGLAAIQVARFLGAEVFATAGSEEKRAYLKSLGIRHVFDSRAIGFANEILRITKGKGLDVALNSLTGAFIPETLSALGEGARFIELGTRQMLDDRQVADLAPSPSVTYHPIDLAQMSRDDPDQYGVLLREVADHVRDGHFKALARKVYPVAQASQAFQLMLQTKHIGKVVLSFADVPAEFYRVSAGTKFAQTGEREFTIEPGREADYLALLRALESAGAKIGHVLHLWNTARAPTPAAVLERQLDRSFSSLTWLGKAIGNRDWSQPIDIVIVATNLQQIAGETTLEPIKATLLGPCRVLPREMPNLTCRIIDIPATKQGSWQRDQVVEQLTIEALNRPDWQIIAYRGTDRWVQRYEPTRLDRSVSHAALRSNGVYLITGGLGGLGLELASHFARVAKAKIILLGRRPFPERAAWPRWTTEHGEDDPVTAAIRKIEGCEAAGGEVMIATGDVTDKRRMRGVVAAARKRFDAIHGVIHAAGNLDDGLIQLKTADSARSVLKPKIEGAVVLDEVCGDEPLDFFVLFSSVSSILGLQGQVDYTAANAFLDAFAEGRSGRRRGRSVAINWGPWREAGMAARANAGASRAVHDGKEARPVHPWLESRRTDRGAVVFFTDFNRARQWVLGEHVIRDSEALIPGTGYLELVRGAFQELEVAPAVEISQVFFQTPFAVRAGETKELEISLRRVGERWEFRVLSEGGSVVHVTGNVAAHPEQPLAMIDAPAIAARCSDEERLKGFLNQPFMDFGPRWGNVRSIRYGKSEALLSLELPLPFDVDLDAIKLHPALLDMATGGAQRLLAEQEGDAFDFYVPFSYGKLVLRKGFSRKIRSHVRRRKSAAPGLAVFDVTISDESGVVLAEITDFTMKRVHDRTSLAAPPMPHVAGAESAATAMAREVQREGISPQEGTEALERILGAATTSRIAVSAVDLRVWQRKLDAQTFREPMQTAQRSPAEDSVTPSLVNASGPVERKLAAMFSQLLGVEIASPRDDFFAVGGHSLLAVRLLARIEKEFGKAVPISVLFERPTIEGLAAFIQGDAPLEDEQVVPVVVPSGGEPVAAFSIDSETAPPLFLMPGMGKDEPRLVRFRAACAHDLRIVAMDYGNWPEWVAADLEFAALIRRLVAEIEAKAPEGPIYLAGYSLGGHIAYATATALLAAGRSVAYLGIIDQRFSKDSIDRNPGRGPATRSNELQRLMAAVQHGEWADELSCAVARRLIGPRWAPLLRLAARYPHAPLPGDLGFYFPWRLSMYLLTEMVRRWHMDLAAGSPEPLLIPTVLFRSKAYPAGTAADLGWRRLCPNLTILPVDGGHTTMFDPPYLDPLSRMFTASVLHAMEAAAERPRENEPVI
jgi:acyl transferase domain-containing protein/thioesterase domain-containing protein/acyl carrier protein